MDHQKTWKDLPPKMMHIELSSYCNAACPFCPRYYHGSEIVRPTLKLDQITLQKFRRYFSQSTLAAFNKILYCGTNGDPLMAKDCYDIFDYVQKINPRCEQIVHTNGGTRSQDFWMRMGQLFSQPNMTVIWSIDGLSDTNHIYRRNVDWQKLEENFKAFISEGGRAVWEFLVFAHNEHQVKEAEAYAKKLGFIEFRSKRALGLDNPVDKVNISRMVYDKDGNVAYKIYPPTDPKYQNQSGWPLKDSTYDLDKKKLAEGQKLKYFPIIKQEVENFRDESASNLGEYANELSKKQVQCKSLPAGRWHYPAYRSEADKNYSEIYVSAEGTVFPCCYVGTRFNADIEGFLDYQIKAKLEPHLDKLDLNKNELQDILKTGVLDKVFAESWGQESVACGKMAYCAETCGANSTLDKIYM